MFFYEFFLKVERKKKQQKDCQTGKNSKQHYKQKTFPQVIHGLLSSLKKLLLILLVKRSVKIILKGLKHYEFRIIVRA